MAYLESTYEDKLRRKLNSFENIKNVLICTLLIERVCFLLKKDGTHKKQNLIDQIYNRESLSDVKKFTIKKVIQLINNEALNSKQQQKIYEELFELIDRDIDIAFDYTFSRLLRTLEDDERFAFYFYVRSEHMSDKIREDRHKLRSFLHHLDQNEDKRIGFSDIFNYLNVHPDLSRLGNIKLCANYNAISTVINTSNEIELPLKGHIHQLYDISESYLKLKKQSKTVIEKNLSTGNQSKNNKFSIWLYTYLDKKLNLDGYFKEVSDKHKLEFTLNLLDYWFIVSPKCHEIVLKLIQTAWHKHQYDAKNKGKKRTRINSKNHASTNTKIMQNKQPLPSSSPNDTDQVQNLTVENKIQDLHPEQNTRYSNLQAGAGKLNLTRNTKYTKPKS